MIKKQVEASVMQTEFTQKGTILSQKKNYTYGNFRPSLKSHQDMSCRAVANIEDTETMSSVFLGEF